MTPTFRARWLTSRTRFRMARYSLAVLVSLVTVSTMSCSSHGLPSAPRYPITIGSKALTVEVALDEAHRERGLMFRKQLGPDEGMLFVYPREDRLSFWMKNTYAPLSVAFIRADGWIAQIEDMAPLDLSTHRSWVRVKFALEMPQGWFERNNVKVGDVVKIPEEAANGGKWE